MVRGFGTKFMHFEINLQNRLAGDLSRSDMEDGGGKAFKVGPALLPAKNGFSHTIKPGPGLSTITLLVHSRMNELPDPNETTFIKPVPTPE